MTEPKTNHANRYYKPHIISSLDFPVAGFWRAKVNVGKPASNNSVDHITLLVTIVAANFSQTTGWTCQIDKISNHGISVPAGTKSIVVRDLQSRTEFASALELKWLGTGLFGRLQVSLAALVKRLKGDHTSEQRSIVDAIRSLPDIVVTRNNASNDLASLSILVPSRDQPELLEIMFQTCFKPVLEQGGEVIVIDHASVLPDTKKILSKLTASGCIVCRAEGPFNYSRLINRAASLATRARYLILNDDVCPFDTNSFNTFAMLNSLDNKAIFAPLLIYPSTNQEDAAVQHAGIFLGMGGLSGHWLRHARLSDPEVTAWRRQPRQVDAVTGAVMLVDRQLFDQLGGFDEKYHVECSDVDFCMRAEQLGWRSVIATDIVWTHSESLSRGKAENSILAQEIDRDRRRFWLQWREAISRVTRLPSRIDPNSETPKIISK